jgi:predicted Fe-S protein YdhL (DUF1289 family)
MAEGVKLSSIKGFGDDVQTPCIRNCCLDNTEICLGCFRSLSEILKWNSATGPEKQEILMQCRLRKEAQGPRWGD